ncbi:MAG TPA: HAMP domain-containing sensor histidine kinase [Myxococcales bacterium]|nr:HAMP domain-containing sensor histidine kinase [Myxococcales bacterium]
MTVARTFALTFALLALVVLFAQSLFLVRLEDARAAERRRTAHQLLGLTLAGSIGAAWQQEGADEAQRLVDEANRFQETIGVRWVWLDASLVTPLHAPLQASQSIQRDSFSAATVETASGRAFVSYTPAHVGQSLGAIEITEPLTDEGVQRPGLKELLLVNSSVTLLIFALVGWWLGVRLVGRPIEQLARMAKQVGAGSLDARVHLHTRTELDTLGEAMNTMAASLDRQTRERDQALEQARHADRLATVGKLAAGLAHELGTPLNVVKGRARTLQGGDLEGPAAELAAAEIIGESDRMAGLVRQLLDFAGKRGGGRARIDASDVVQHTLALLQPIAAKRGITFLAKLAPAPLFADAGQLQQVATNLILNAVQASPDGAAVEVSVEADGEIALRVRDRGAGLSEEVRAHLFEPFFTTRPRGEGTGLGLAVSFGIVSELRGSIDAANAEGGGAVFTVRLPRSDS